MKEFLLAVLAVVVIGFGAMLVLEGFQRSSDSASVGTGTRLDVPGAKPKG